MTKKRQGRKSPFVLLLVFATLLSSSIFQDFFTIEEVSRNSNGAMKGDDFTATADVQKNLTGSSLRTSDEKSEKPTAFLLPNADDFRPVTQLNRRQKCAFNPNQPLKKITGLFENYSNISQLFHLPIVLDLNIPLVCKFDTNQPYSNHFAHTMQQIYACYSFYQEYAGEREKIFLIPSKIRNSLEKIPFLHGFFQFLETEMKVQITNDRAFNHTRQASPTRTYIPGGYIVAHTRELNRQVEAFLGVSASSNDVDCISATPRIGILNRRPSSGRSIQNIADIVDALNDYSSNRTVSLEYFEGSSFQDQAAFFQSIDILLSPHGAQNTGLPFMANKQCKSFWEVFPDNYILPAFYGSLARNSGIAYSYLYLSGTDSAATELNKEESTLAERTQARAANICLSIKAVQAAIEELVLDWKSCCGLLS